MSKKSSSGSALSVLAMRWLSTAWLPFWLSLRPGRLPPAADDSSSRRPWAPETFADSDMAAERRDEGGERLAAREQQRVLKTSSLGRVRLETAARGPTFPDGSWRRLWPTVQRQPAAFGLHRAPLVVHAVALEAAQQVEEPLVPKGVRTGSLKKIKGEKHQSCSTDTGSQNHLEAKCCLSTFWGPGVVSRVLLVSWRTLVEPPNLYFFPRRRLTKKSFEELLARDGLDWLARMSLLHF